jgi:hypothetical protein
MIIEYQLKSKWSQLNKIYNYDNLYKNSTQTLIATISTITFINKINWLKAHLIASIKIKFISI